jgi:hypothetical protein
MRSVRNTLPYPGFTAVLLIILATACAPAAAPRSPAPAPVGADRPVSEWTGELQPSPASLRAAETAVLTGLELGTMWTFENPPLEYWQRTYGFSPTQEWLDHVRLASVRYGQHCSASFVSPTGLVMTNHHCALDCIEAVSTEANDYVVDGFYAPSRGQELTCPGLFLDQLVEIQDVTARVHGAAPAGAAAEQVAAAQARVRSQIQEECEAATGRACQVVALYHGGQYQLYQYRRYAPVKLVWAPDSQAGFYGGDPDNFTYPRYNLDVTFLRAYEEDGQTAASTPDYFRWNPRGAEDGEVVFITGNPGSTARLATVSQLLYEQGMRHPFVVEFLGAQSAVLHAYAERGPDQEREVRETIFNVDNSLKAYTGQLGGLQDTLLMGRKIRWEREFRGQVRADRQLAAAYGDAWDRMADVAARRFETYSRVNLYNLDFLGDPHVQMAGLLVRYVRESERPEAERLPAFRGDRLAQVRQMLESAPAPDPTLALPMLAVRLDLAGRWLPEGDPVYGPILRAGEEPAAAAARIAGETRITDAAFRRQLAAGGVAALEASTDPVVALARRMDTQHRQVLARWQQIGADQTVQEQRLAEALFAVFGTQIPPDATFTLRITDGVVAGYPFNGTMAPPFTSLYGLYERANNFGNRMPWTLPRAFAERRAQVELATRYNFVTTNDITGGNSGSPMVDREGRIVGIAFDGNIEQLPNEFLFSVVAGRTVGVHSAGILEALRNVYRTPALLEELTGDAPARVPAEAMPALLPDTTRALLGAEEP